LVSSGCGADADVSMPLASIPTNSDRHSERIGLHIRRCRGVTVPRMPLSAYEDGATDRIGAGVPVCSSVRFQCSGCLVNTSTINRGPASGDLTLAQCARRPLSGGYPRPKPEPSEYCTGRPAPARAPVCPRPRRPPASFKEVPCPGPEFYPTWVGGIEIFPIPAFSSSR
jgi:hypothetical protein